jgi:hypothetical protein
MSGAFPRISDRRAALVPRAGACLAALAAAGAALGCGHDAAPDAPDAPDTEPVAFAPGQGAVHGFVDASVAAGTTTTFALPDATIQLKRTSDSSLTAAVITDVHGAFTASSVPVGTYAICLTATTGFSNACTTATFTVSAGKIAYPPHAVFGPQRIAVWGRARLSDGADVRYENSLFGKQVDTFVRAVTLGGVLAAGPVRANSRGQYVLPRLSPNTSYHIIAQSENTVVDNLVAIGTAPFQNNPVLPNRRPAVAEVDALQGGVGVRHVVAGSVVTVGAVASDPDGNGLHYQWLAPNGGSCAGTDAASLDCTVSSTLGVQSIYVQVSDGRGQYAVGRVRVEVGAAVALFTGKVITDGSAAVPGAEVHVNAAATTTSAAGAFSLTVPEANRYVVTIKKDGFQMISKVYLAERIGATYVMRKADMVVIDPTIDNTVPVRAPKTDTGAQPYGDVMLTLHAGSIVDSAGNRVITPVTVYKSRFDHLFDPYDRMPGDYAGKTTDGTDTTLTSFGAVEVNLRGGGGQKYNLAAGMPADLVYPVHPSQIASAPPTLPLWYYNEDTGIWEQDGVATLVSGAYTAQAKHFTAVNVDLAKQNATCVKLVVDQTTLQVPIKIRLSVPGFPDKDRDITENVSAIVRLPPNIANTKIVVLDGSNQPIPNSTRIFTTGDALPDGTNLSLPAPYNVCITPPSPPVTLGLDLPQNPNPYWLTKKINPGATDADRSNYGNQYYAAIAADANLTAWKIRNEFAGGDDAQGFYLNAADLEFGRSMHMKKRSDGGVAYYVTNFADADKALGGNPADVIATVAMEYSKYPSNVAGAPKFTKFYVFDKAGNLTNHAELDNRGDKYVPGLCVVCHGGTLPVNIAGASPPGNTESRFIPFDLKSFASSPLLPGFPAMLDRNAQEENFRKLNEGVYLLTSPTDAEKSLIEAWYDPSVSNPGQHQQDGNIPFNWTATANDSQFYTDVVGPSCRSCHTSRGPGLDFNDPVSFQGNAIEFAVCTTGQMPQSFVAWRNFWHSTSPHQATRVEQYMGLAAGSCVGPQ